MTDDLFSRSELTGYDAEILSRAKVLVVGCGALGQNLALDLALSGIGNLAVVDPDRFEPHNATRSPLYPTNGEPLVKASHVAQRLQAMATAPDAVVSSADAWIEDLGDAPIVWADVVCAAVDDPHTRAYLSDRCRLIGRPLVDAGFEGTAVQVGVLAADAGAACYRCLNPDLHGSVSCRAYAAAAEAARIVPAIQTSAAVLGGLQAEQTIGVLHNWPTLMSKRTYLDLRSLHARTAEVTAAQRCIGLHEMSMPRLRVEVRPVVDRSRSLGDVLADIEQAVGAVALRLPTEVVGRAWCRRCGALCEVLSLEPRWRRQPFCDACEGPWAISPPGTAPAVYDIVDDTIDDAIAQRPLVDLGVGPATNLIVYPREWRAVTVMTDGQPDLSEFSDGDTAPTLDREGSTSSAATGTVAWDEDGAPAHIPVVVSSTDAP